MANVLFGGGVAAMRGSIGGVVFSAGPGGAIARNRTKPINPRSPLQIVRRANTAQLMKRWSNDLTEQQRTDWRAYAAGTSWTNKLGQSITIAGIAAFLRLNALQLLIPAPIIDAAPLAVGHAGGITQTFAAESDTTKIQLDEPGGSFDNLINVHTIYYFMGLPTEIGRKATPKGFRYIGRVWGSPGAPLSYPYELDAEYTMTSGQFITLRMMFQDENYRVSGPFFATATAAPSG